MPTYNNSNFIKESIESVINQNCIFWELIIVDDGSTDKTRNIVNTYISDKRIKYCYQENLWSCCSKKLWNFKIIRKVSGIS